jgi:hypothetical protein
MGARGVQPRDIVIDSAEKGTHFPWFDVRSDRLNLKGGSMRKRLKKLTTSGASG